MARSSRSARRALTLSVVIALVTVWLSIALSYQTTWPLGFFVGVIGSGFYLVGLAARGPGDTRVRPA